MTNKEILEDGIVNKDAGQQCPTHHELLDGSVLKHTEQGLDALLTNAFYSLVFCLEPSQIFWISEPHYLVRKL